MKKYFYILSVFILISCSKTPIKEFTIKRGNEFSTIKLFSDSSFQQENRLLERNFTFTGTWKGNFEEGDTFVLNKNNTSTYYFVKEGNAIDSF